MASITISLSDEMRALAEARMKAGLYADIGDYVRDLIRDDLAGGWEVDEAMAAAIDEGEASGLGDKSIQDVFAEARAKYRSA